MKAAEILALARVIGCKSITGIGGHNTYGTFRLVRECLEGDAPIEAKWSNGYAGAAPSIHREHTYESCVDLQVNFDDRITIKVAVWDGDLLDGRRTWPRCQFLYEVTDVHPRLTIGLIMPRLLKEVGRRALHDMDRDAEAARDREMRRRVDAYIAVAEAEAS